MKTSEDRLNDNRVRKLLVFFQAEPEKWFMLPELVSLSDYDLGTVYVTLVGMVQRRQIDIEWNTELWPRRRVFKLKR